MICARIDTSSAETGSSSTMSLGFRHQRARHRDALALAAAELVRVEVGLLRAQPDAAEHLGDALLDLLRDSLRLTTSGSATMSRTRMRGLSDDQGPGTPPAPWCGTLELVAAQGVHVLAVDEHVPVGRLLQPQDQLGRRRLAAAGLADQGQGLALADREADAVDRLDPADDLRPEHALGHREVLLQALERGGSGSAAMTLRAASSGAYGPRRR